MQPEASLPCITISIITATLTEATWLVLPKIKDQSPIIIGTFFDPFAL